MRKLILFLAAVSLVLFAEKALCYETTFSIEPESFNSFRYEEMRVEGPIELSIRTGRFLSVDPLLDTKEALHEPQLWNRYSYVTNNPLKFTDPDGRYRTFYKEKPLSEVGDWSRSPAVSWAFYAQGGLLGLAAGGPLRSLGSVLWNAALGNPLRIAQAGAVAAELANPNPSPISFSADAVVATGRMMQRAQSTESVMLAALKSHIDRGHASAELFKGIPKTEAAAEQLVRSIIDNRADVVKMKKYIEVYDVAGRGVRLRHDGSFVTFVAR